MIKRIQKNIVALCIVFSAHLLSNFHPHSFQNVVRLRLLFFGCIRIIAERAIQKKTSKAIRMFNEFIVFKIKKINIQGISIKRILLKKFIL